MKNKQSEKALLSKWNEAMNVIIEIGKQLPPEKPTREDIRFKKTLENAMMLSKELEPATKDIFSSFKAVLTEREMDLLCMYEMLIVGSTLSMYAPRHLAASELSKSNSMRFFISCAKRAEKLMKAQPTEDPIKTDERIRQAIESVFASGEMISLSKIQRDVYGPADQTGGAHFARIQKIFAEMKAEKAQKAPGAIKAAHRSARAKRVQSKGAGVAKSRALA